MNNEAKKVEIPVPVVGEKLEDIEDWTPEVVIFVPVSENMCASMGRLVAAFQEWLEMVSTMDEGKAEEMEDTKDMSEAELTEPPVIMMTVIPGFRPEMASPEEAAEVLTCFGESDEIDVLADLEVLISYDENQLVHLPSGNYLTGPAVFFNVDEEGNDVSLEAGELYNIQKYIEANTVTLKNNTQEMKAISLGEWR